MSQLIRVLVVDDSAYVRKVLTQMLSRSPLIEVVGTARDGIDALDQVERLHPDVVTLDLIMPELDGVGFLKAQMARGPLPVLVVSIASESNEQILAAFEAGAVDVMQKPTALTTERLFEIADELIAKVKLIARVPIHYQPPSAPMLTPAPWKSSGRIDIVVIGISTGGPQGLKQVIPLLSADFSAPVAIVLHMPIGYTELYARSLDALAPLTVGEAHAGDPVRPGNVLIAPAGQHLTFQRTADHAVRVYLDTRPIDTPHCPSVDVLFKSAAEVYGKRVLGIVMTGMGADGLNGAAWIKAHGGIVWTEAEETCVVYGMPRAVAEAGLSDRCVPLTELAYALQEIV